MKRILSVFFIITILSLAGCSDNDQSQEQEQDHEEENITETEETSSKFLSAGEEVVFKDSDGNDMYSLKVNSVNLANDFEYKEDFSDNVKQIVELDYTYTNIAKDDESGLEITTEDLLLADSNGELAERSYMYPKKLPEVIRPGFNSNIHAYYGLAKESESVKISFTSKAYKKSVVFEIPVTE